LKFERIQTPEVSRGKALRSKIEVEQVIRACCEYFRVAREEMMRSGRSESRKICIYLIKKHTCATNREIAELFGTLTYSAVAKISGSVSKQLAVNEQLQEQIKKLEIRYSFFKA
jgi:chromosomal replication initiation ATPase DnaA